MEAFNLLKFWRSPVPENVTAAASDVITDSDYINSDYKKTPTTPSSSSTDVRDRAPEIDDGDSFFDLEFTALDNKDNELNAPKRSCDNSCKFLESPTDVFRSEIKPQSKPKFKVLMLHFKKSKTEINSKNLTNPDSRRSFENERSENANSRNKMIREILQESNSTIISKKSQNDSKSYLKLIKPLYTVASKRYSCEKNRLSAVSPVEINSPRRSSDEKKGGNRGSGFKVVYKHLGKSRSASSAVGVVTCQVKRRDDSLLLHNDGIQSAILHCKRSYNCNNTGLSRYSSDLSPEKLVIEEQKRCSI